MNVDRGSPPTSKTKNPSWCSLQMGGAMLSGDPAIFPNIMLLEEKGWYLYLTGSKNPTTSRRFCCPTFWKNTSQVLKDFFFCINNICYIIVFFQWLGIKQSHCGQWICSIWLFLHVFKRCHLISIPFDAQLLQRTWQKSRILVVKSHDENPR